MHGQTEPVANEALDVDDDDPAGAARARTLDRLSRIGQAITASFAFADIFSAIESHIGELIDAATFYIGVLDERAEWIDIPLFVDGGVRAASRRFRVDDPDRPACLAVRASRELLRHKTLEEAIRSDIPGTVPTLTALFRPLVVQGRTIGVMSVQSARAFAYSDRERLIFRTLCSYVAVALANAASFRRLAAIEPLEILGEAGQEITSSLDVADILSCVARHMEKLVGPSALAIGLLDAEARRLDFPLAVAGGLGATLPPVGCDDRESPEAEAIRSREEIVLPVAPSRVGPDAGPVAGLVRPLLARDRPIGTITIETDRADGFGERAILAFRTLAAYIAVAIANAQAFRDVQTARSDATSALGELRLAQEGLIQAEKMASLGALVAGVAHEVNTPVGTALTVATTFERTVREFRDVLETGPLRRSELAEFVAKADEAARLLALNLTRASDLVGRFKAVAADRTSDDQRRFDLSELIGAILTSLTSELRRQPHVVEVEVPVGIELDSYPGALGQILVNLVMNAIVHAFPDGRGGTVRIEAVPRPGDEVRIVVSDDGIGVSRESLQRIFEPFFTTRRNQGGTGLGLHIAYNLAVKTLEGRLTCRSEPGRGAAFRLDIPLRVRVRGGPGS